MYIVRVQSLRFVEALEHFSHVLDLALEHRVTGYVTQVSELEMHRADFREYAASAARPGVVPAHLLINRVLLFH